MQKRFQMPMPMAVNGYSNYRQGRQESETFSDFTIQLAITPYTYETCESGIFCAYDAETKDGVRISIAKGGVVSIRLGTGKQEVEIRSRQQMLSYQSYNTISLSFWGTAGWCDLCINGALDRRIQIQRHSTVRFPEHYVFGTCMAEEVERFRGIFHGKIHYFTFDEGYMPYAQVSKMQQAFRLEVAEAIDLYADTDVKKDRYRPVYHLMPPAKWMNEPHAPLFHKGYYHIFYQANPHAPVWDNLCWGHLLSRDMVTWKDGGIALCPDTDASYDRDGCWSGSACADEQGVWHLFYTAGNQQMLPNQAVAMASPVASEDARLKEWKKDGIILTQDLDAGFLGEFRDPFVFRRGAYYYMLVGSGDADNGGGNALVYRTKDFKEFCSGGFLVDYDYEECPEVGHVWELPVLLPLRNEFGEYACDILLLCACQIEQEVVETYYFLGKFSEETMRFETSQKKPGLLDLGYGTFTGPSGFVTPDGRSVVFTISQGKRNFYDEIHAGWAHNGGLPVELSLQKDALKLQPIQELGAYFTTASDETEHLLEHKVVLTSNQEQLEFLLWTGDNAIEIMYHRKSGAFYARDHRSQTVISKFRGTEDCVWIGEEAICIELYVDHSMLEIYLNQKKSMTLRNYEYENGYRLEIPKNQEVQVACYAFGDENDG